MATFGVTGKNRSGSQARKTGSPDRTSDNNPYRTVRRNYHVADDGLYDLRRLYHHRSDHAADVFNRSAGFPRISSGAPPGLPLCNEFHSRRGGMSRSLTRPHPGRVEAGDRLEHRAIGTVRSRQIPRAHQEFTGDLATGKAEGLFEQGHPIVFFQGMMMIEPG